MAATDNERLVAWLKKKRGEMSYAQFAEISGVSKSTLQRFESGEGELSLASKALLAKAFADFPTWALDRDVLRRYETQAVQREFGVAEPPAKYSFSPRVSRTDEFVRVPLYGIVAGAGDGKWNDEERIESDLMFRRDWLMGMFGTTKGLSLVTADGDSMINTFRDGAVVMVRELQSWNFTEGVFLLRLDGRLMLKRLRHLGYEGGLGEQAVRALVICDNDDKNRYPSKEVVFGPHNAADNDVIARAVWTGSKLE